MIDITKDYLFKDGTCPITKAALEDLVGIHLNLFLIARLPMINKELKETLDNFIWRVNQTNYFNEYRKIDDDRYDIEYYDADAELGRIDSCIITVSINRKTGNLELCNDLEFSIKGCDDLITYDLEDVIYTLSILDTNT